MSCGNHGHKIVSLFGKKYEQSLIIEDVYKFDEK